MVQNGGVVMGCKNPRTFWVKANNRYSLAPEGTLLPGQDAPVHPDFAGTKGGFQAGRMVTVDCRVCWSCILRAQNSMIGSLLGESQNAKHVVAFTGTYANDPGSDTRSDLAHKMLTKPHIREMTQRLVHDRSLGRFRYFMAGEYGPLRGRAHWHGVFIFEDNMPAFDFSAERYNDNRIWPYGFMQARPVTDLAQLKYVVKYAAKSSYAMKDDPVYLPGVDTALMRSRIPPLGLPFFIEQAIRCADFGIPLSMRYMPPAGDPKANYHVKGLRSRSAMALAYLDHLDLMGYDTRYYEWVPGDYQFTGPRIPISPDADINRLIEAVVRQRRLDAVPDLSPRRALTAIKADFAEREAKQERLNAAIAKRRASDAVKRKVAENLAFTHSFRTDPHDPWWSEFDSNRHALDLVRTGSWRDD